MTQIEISVLLPVYNSQAFLKEAIESILSQSLKNFELIIINDGSTDNSESIIKSFMDSRIVYLKNPENIGLIKTLNKAIAIAKGNYLARMDADDVAMKDRLDLQLKAFQENKNRVVVSSDHFLLQGNKETYIKNHTQSDELKAILLFSPCFAHPTVMIKNIFVKENISYNEKYTHTEDYKLWTDLAICGEFYNINTPLLKYRSHPNQVSILNNSIQKQRSEEVRSLYLQKLGFVFSEEEFVTHNFIGNNVFINSIVELEKIEKWLLSLLNQNKKLKAFNQNQFQNIITKFWYDSCGYSCLGLKAFLFCFGSEILIGQKVSFNTRFRLLGKCIIRSFAK
jgi:glycosyltransferase involved in cell wall biosynthesis